VNIVTAASKLWGLMSRAQRRGLVLLLGAMCIGMMFEAVGVGLIVPLVAILTQADYLERVPALKGLLETLGNPSRTVVIVLAMAGLVVLYFCKTTFLALLAWRQARFAFAFQADVSQRVFAAYLHRPYTFHLQRNSAQLIRNVTIEVSAMTSYALLPAMLLIAEALVLMGLFALLLAVEPIGALTVAGVLSVAALLFYQATRRRTAHWGLARQRHEGLRIQHLQQALGGVKDVKLLGREAEFLAQYSVHNAQSARVAGRQATLQQLPRLWLELLAVCGLAILVLTTLIQGHALEAILPTLAVFAAAAFRIMPSANRVIGGIQSMRYGLPAVDTVYAELESAPTVPAVADDAPRAPFVEIIEVLNARFTYPGATAQSLNDLSLWIRQGEAVGFVGTSGAGKTTLVDLLLGLLKPDAGYVRADGKDIQTNLRNWQSQIGYVPQSIFLTDDTLRRNVAFGLAADQIDEAAVWRAIRSAQLDEFVRTLPDGLDTLVGERGVRLSGGQRQRIGIARALYHDPPILVLDEATSSLDVSTERGVMQAVMTLHGGKTLLIVAHRFSTVEKCDRLYRLEFGSIVEEGTPDSMLRVRNTAN
jgi:ATP-binding cassette, subfamily B, bacterial PglK